MRTPKISTKRVLGLGLAVALAAGTTLAVAANSQAVTVPSLSLSPATGPSANTTQVVAVTGKGFLSGSTSQVGVTGFDSAACTTGASSTLVTVTSPSVVSATKLTLTTPSLALTGTSTLWYLCVFSNAGTPTLLGQGKYTVYPQPTVTAVSTTSVSDLGGTSVDITGTNFTKGTKVTFGGVAASKVTFTSATAVTAVAPAHVPSATAVPLAVTDEGGSATAVTAANLLSTYVSAIKVTPSTGTPAVVHTIDITGSGFTAANATAVTLTGGPSGGAPTCANFRLVSSTEATCDVTSVTADAGAYIVKVTGGGTPTVVSSGATYTIANF
jgi:hypothetical protein